MSETSAELGDLEELNYSKTWKCEEYGHRSNPLELLQCVSRRTLQAISEKNSEICEVIHEIEADQLSILFPAEITQLHLIPEEVLNSLNSKQVEFEIKLGLHSGGMFYEDSIVIKSTGEHNSLFAIGNIVPPKLSDDSIETTITLSHKTNINKETKLFSQRKLYLLSNEPQQNHIKTKSITQHSENEWPTLKGEYFELLRERNELSSLVGILKINNRLISGQLESMINSRSWKIAKYIQLNYAKFKRIINL